MSKLLTVALTPIVLFISFPLFIFAIFTTSLAFSTLLLRVLIVYVELGVVVIHNQFSSPAPTGADQSLTRKKSGRSIATSRSSSGSLTPRLTAPGSAIYPATPLARDFEGVGGWRFPDQEDDDSDTLWTGMNARLELPAAGISGGDHKFKHERSLTTSAVATERPGFKRAGSQRPRPISAFVSGTTSPEEMFGEGKTSRSVTDMRDTSAGLGMNMGKVRRKHRKSSSSSTGSSGKTMRGSGTVG
ncbi:hypothetical protein MMC13_003123 [Lambiella insularis]|nr:hypothetical protein [Lambiella insularis]